MNPSSEPRLRSHAAPSATTAESDSRSPTDGPARGDAPVEPRTRPFPTAGRTISWRRHPGEERPGRPAQADSIPELTTEALEAAEARLTNYDPLPDWAPRAGRRDLTAKLLAGLAGFKHAFRGDSSFFAHAYRALLVFLTSALIGLPPLHWALLILGLSLVLIAELAHSAIDQLARAIGDPEEPRLRTTRDIAASMVLVAVVGSASISILVLSVRFMTLLGP
ncbi:MAG: diacylglycerol kinase [Isosphaeraceae bacterium]|nr:diacylglycerol kinase [Isosphaeraceae bacterium]